MRWDSRVNVIEWRRSLDGGWLSCEASRQKQQNGGTGALPAGCRDHGRWAVMTSCSSGSGDGQGRRTGTRRPASSIATSYESAPSQLSSRQSREKLRLSSSSTSRGVLCAFFAPLARGRRPESIAAKNGESTPPGTRHIGVGQL